MDEALIRLQEEELQRTGRYYKHICFLCVPLLCVSCYLYGLRPLLLCGFAVLMGNLCDRLISLLRRRVYQAADYSNESFALVITLLMPATVDWYVLAAAILAETQWGITDPEILSAIRCHTTGKPDMSKLDKILYLADMTSAERDWPGVEELRALEMEDLDRALCDALKRSIDFVEEKDGTLDPESVAAYEYAKAHLK